MDDVELICRLIPRWHARRSEFEQMVLDRFQLEQISDLLPLGKSTKPLQVPGTEWYCWTHGIGVRITRLDETGGIDFDFDKDRADAWRLRHFAECQVEENAEDADLLRSIAADRQRFERAFDEAIERMRA